MSENKIRILEFGNEETYISYNKLKTENKRLREYVHHKHDCDKIKIDPDGKCTCGLDDLLKDKL